MTRKTPAIAAAVVAAALGAGAEIGYLSDDPPAPPKPDPCAQGWPPESYCFPGGSRIIGPDGTVYRGGGVYQ